MSTSLYEGYKEALRRGHVAALRGRHDIALAAYRDAARIAPDRALPYVGLGGALAKLGRLDEALGAFRVALERAPDDEGALRGQADVLAGEGRAAEAAGSLDRLAAVLERAGRLADACDTARRALELAESRGRRRLVQSIAARLRQSEDPAAAQALERALSILEAEPVTVAASTESKAEAEAPPDEPQTGPDTGTTTVESQAAALAATAGPAPRPVRRPPPDPLALARAFEAAVDAGDLDQARKQAVTSASAYRAEGQFHAAIDACYEALAIAPADPGIHFALAQTYLDRGWRSLAADKLVLIGRLAQLNGDTATIARLCDLVTRRFPDDARLTKLCI